MGSVEGFLKVDRELPKSKPPQDRIGDYKEIYQPHAEELTVDQASRCMDCGVPFCHNGCPLGNFIPDFNDAVYRQSWEKAAELLLATNNFPEFTGRICPAPCEGSCVLGINKPPVAIEHIEKSIIEKAYELGLIKPQPPTQRIDKKVAIIGSGPAGLAAADQLNKAGYQVTIYERDKKPGGLLRFGIPDFKLEKWVVERRVSALEAEGIEFVTECNVGVDITGDELKLKYDAVVLCGGSTIPRDVSITGRELKGVHFAMEFLTQQNKRVSEIPFEEEDILATGKDVIVIGGGDTGSDCIGTSNRHQAKSILQFELLDKPPVGRSGANPWPEWPLILRTSSSHEEGCEREWSILTKEFIGNDKGEITGLKTVKIEWDGRSFKEIEGTEQVHPCDLALLAVGFVHPQKEGLLDQLGVALDERGNVSTRGYQTSIDKVFAAGDMRRGQSLVVWAISEGREAARMVDQYLEKESKLPSKLVSEYQV
ncbi:MAG: glutamate synthase subunit beta [Cyclobacteriaceae bacterium]|nr:glutamate synthase subunit beta [Cyclobacteriaceae bacterium HetDA_MAG_MS6]